MSEKTTKVETQITSQEVDLNRELLLDFKKKVLKKIFKKRKRKMEERLNPIAAVV